MISEERINALRGVLHDELRSARSLSKTMRRFSCIAGILVWDKKAREIKRVIEDLNKDPQGTYQIFIEAVNSPKADIARLEKEKVKRLKKT